MFLFYTGDLVLTIDGIIKALTNSCASLCVCGKCQNPGCLFCSKHSHVTLCLWKMERRERGSDEVYPRILLLYLGVAGGIIGEAYRRMKRIRVKGVSPPKGWEFCRDYRGRDEVDFRGSEQRIPFIHLFVHSFTSIHPFYLKY